MLFNSILLFLELTVTVALISLSSKVVLVAAFAMVTVPPILLFETIALAPFIATVVPIVLLKTIASLATVIEVPISFP